jgi:AcrR family transcriptional regulator
MTARRDAGRPRGKPIERAILAATLGELAEHGVDGVSIPRIALACEVNKTTIYRRWPTREALVAAALEGALRESAEELRDTGSLRGDLRLLVGVITARLASPAGRALARAAMSEQSAAEVGALARDPGVREQDAAVALVARATARGEWDPARHAPDAVLAMIVGGILHRVLLERLPVTPEWAEVLVDVIVCGLTPDRPPA